jgi:hypothetical protein
MITLTPDQARQLASWLREDLQYEHVPTSSLSLDDPTSWGRVHCAVTGCETCGSAMSLTPNNEPRMWALMVRVGRQMRSIPLCRDHAVFVELAFAPPRQPPRGTSIAPLRPLCKRRLQAARAAHFANIMMRTHDWAQ